MVNHIGNWFKFMNLPNPFPTTKSVKLWHMQGFCPQPALPPSRHPITMVFYQSLISRCSFECNSGTRWRFNSRGVYRGVCNWGASLLCL